MSCSGVGHVLNVPDGTVRELPDWHVENVPHGLSGTVTDDRGPSLVAGALRDPAPGSRSDTATRRLVVSPEARDYSSYGSSSTEPP